MFATLILAGNLGSDPESRFTPSGSQVTNMSVAVNHNYTNAAGVAVKETTWFRVAAWGKMAENCQKYLKKGSKVLVEGRLNADEKGNPRTFTRSDGSTGASFEVTAQTVRFLSSANENGNGNGNGAHEEMAPESFASDDIPF